MIATRLRQVVRVSGFGALTASMLVAYSAVDKAAAESARDALRDKWVKRWCGALLSLFSIDVIVRGNVPKQNGSKEGRLVVSNHRSTIDIAILLQNFGGHIVSRGDLSNWPLIGRAAKKAGTIFVDRQAAASGATAVRTMHRMLQQGATISLFPEGTTFPDDELRPFHAGAFVAASLARVPVVPIGIAYARGSGAAFVGESFPKHLARMAGSGRTRVAVVIGDPIQPEAKVRSAALSQAVHKRVQQLIHEARRIVDGET